VVHFLQRYKHGHQRPDRTTETEHAKDGKGTYHTVITKLGVVGTESTGLAFLLPDVLHQDLIQCSFDGSVFLVAAVLLGRDL
jgi:hypothetical protein